MQQITGLLFQQAIVELISSLLAETSHKLQDNYEILSQKKMALLKANNHASITTWLQEINEIDSFLRNSQKTHLQHIIELARILADNSNLTIEELMALEVSKEILESSLSNTEARRNHFTGTADNSMTSTMVAGTGRAADLALEQPNSPTTGLNNELSNYALLNQILKGQ